MRRTPVTAARRLLHAAIRTLVGWLPVTWRHALYRSLAECDPSPDPRLELKIAQTEEELEACFRLLHDAYVASGFMRPDPSGLRVTIYHALPTTTTLCAKWDGRVVGTLSLIREGVFGFPLQSAFDLATLRAAGGNVAEVSALAVDPAFRATGGKVLFPLMKFMYEYSRRYFDTRHLVIAVNPNKIELYEALLGFRRLREAAVDRYDFANGAPAIGATLDLDAAEQQFRARYDHLPPRRNLYRYFVDVRLPHIQWPARPIHTTNDPVLTPALMDHFFNRRTRTFAGLDQRQRMLLRSIYDLDAYADVLPRPGVAAQVQRLLRHHQRFSIRCPARLYVHSYGAELSFDLMVVDASSYGLMAECEQLLPEGIEGRIEISLGEREHAVVNGRAVRRRRSEGRTFYGFSLREVDPAWRRCVEALSQGRTQADLVDGLAAQSAPCALDMPAGQPALTEPVAA